VPPKVFSGILDEWTAALGDKKVDCGSDESFCITDESCHKVAKKLKPIGLQLSS
jgi:hypothetical protein